MDENNKDNTFDNQYTNVNETINQGNVATEDVAAGDVAAGDAAGDATAENVATLNAATAELGAGFQTATSFGGLAQDVDPFVEKQKDWDDLLNLLASKGGATWFQSYAEFNAHENIDPEDPLFQTRFEVRTRTCSHWTQIFKTLSPCPISQLSHSDHTTQDVNLLKMHLTRILFRIQERFRNVREY